jgi:hypothetical protein
MSKVSRDVSFAKNKSETQARRKGLVKLKGYQIIRIKINIYIYIYISSTDLYVSQPNVLWQVMEALFSQSSKFWFTVYVQLTSVYVIGDHIPNNLCKFTSICHQ